MRRLHGISVHPGPEPGARVMASTPNRPTNCGERFKSSTSVSSVLQCHFRTGFRNSSINFRQLRQHGTSLRLDVLALILGCQVITRRATLPSALAGSIKCMASVRTPGQESFTSASSTASRTRTSSFTKLPSPSSALSRTPGLVSLAKCIDEPRRAPAKHSVFWSANPPSPCVRRSCSYCAPQTTAVAGCADRSTILGSAE